MKKKASSIRKEIRYVKVFREDIQESYEILRSASSDVEFEVDEYFLDAVAEISDLKKEKANSIAMKIHDPYVTLVMRRYSIEIYTSESDLISEGIVYRLMNTLSKHKMVFLEWLDNLPMYIISPFMLFGFLMGTTFYKTNIGLAITGLVVFSITVLFSLAILVSSSKEKVKIYLTNSKDRPSFLERNKDELVLMIIGVIIGAIIGKFI